jgi:DNA invertase Pin-like site-specific DNA recombinase
MSEQPIAVGYLRKSTKGERLDSHGQRRERQEKSIAQQKAEVVKLAKGRFEIVKWFEDEGISGWKRQAKRPDFQKMLDEVNQLGPSPSSATTSTASAGPRSMRSRKT